MRLAPFCAADLFFILTKGVKSIVSIEPKDAAKWAAIGASGAAVIGTLAVWPFMRKLLRQYDDAHNIEAGKNVDGSECNAPAPGCLSDSQSCPATCMSLPVHLLMYQT
jgi:hypothetical protein